MGFAGGRYLLQRWRRDLRASQAQLNSQHFWISRAISCAGRGCQWIILAGDGALGVAVSKLEQILISALFFHFIADFLRLG